mgnify:CR=1 FL=1
MSAILSGMGRTIVLILSLVLPLHTTAGAETPSSPAETWRSAINSEHPLVGKLIRVRDGQAVTPARLVSAAATARFVMLGETHDNPDHHRLQAWTIRAMTANGRTPAVAFEMLDADQAEDLAAYLDKPDATASGLGPAVGWAQRGWPAWSQYQPIAAAALNAGLPIRAADVARPIQRKVGRRGYKGAVPPAGRARLALDKPLAAPLRKRLLTDLKQAHCNMLPDSALAPMARVQRLRDAVMADSLIAGDEASDDGAVLIAGRGHARADRGAPWYLRKRLDAPSILTLGIVEVFEGRTDWQSYLPDTPDGTGAAFDYIWFTPRFDDTDHCAELRKRMRSERD